MFAISLLAAVIVFEFGKPTAAPPRLSSLNRVTKVAPCLVMSLASLSNSFFDKSDFFFCAVEVLPVQK